MRNKIQREALSFLSEKGYKSYFCVIEGTPADSEANNPFIIKNDYGYLELKDEFKDEVSSMSIADLLQIRQTQDIKEIKGWVKFFGILVIIQLIAGIIIALALWA